MDVQHMLDNMACACQRKHICEEPVTMGAILRSIVQFIESSDDHGDIDFIKFKLKSHKNYED